MAKAVEGPQVDAVVNLIIKNQEEMLKKLKEAQKGLEKFTTIVKKTEEGFKKLTLSVTSFAKTVAMVYLPRVAKMAQPLLDFNVAAVKGAAAVGELRKSIESMPSAEKFISLSQAAALLGTLAVKSFTNMYNLVPKNSKQLVELGNNLNKIFGPEGQKEIETFFASFQDDIYKQDAVMSAIKSKNWSLAEMLVGTSGGDIKSLERIKAAMGEPFDEAVAGITKYNAATARVTAEMNDMFMRFVYDNSDLIQSLFEKFMSGVTKVFDYIKTHKDSINKTFATLASILEKVVGWIMKLVEWFNKLPFKDTAFQAGLLYFALHKITGLSFTSVLRRLGSVAGLVGSLFTGGGGAGAAGMMGKAGGALGLAGTGGLFAAGAGIGVGASLLIDRAVNGNWAWEGVQSSAPDYNYDKMSSYFKKQKGPAAAGPPSDIKNLQLAMATLAATEKYTDIARNRLQYEKESAKLTGNTAELQGKIASYMATTKKLQGDITDAQKLLRIEYDRAKAKSNQAEMDRISMLMTENDVKLEKASLDILNAQKEALEAQLLPIKNKIEMNQKDMRISQLNMQIAENVYGTAAFAVASAIEYAQRLEQQKQLQMDSLKAIQAQIAATDNSADGMKIKRELLLQERDIQADIKQSQLEQLQTLKKIRDGYIDAVQAQTFGLGAFSKLLVSREENVGLAQNMGMARRNYLLGLVQGPGARQVQSYKFGAYGGFEGATGVFGRNQLAERQATVTGRLSENQRMLSDLSKGTNMAVVAGAYNIGAQSASQLQAQAGMSNAQNIRMVGTQGRSAVSAASSAGSSGSTDAAYQIRQAGQLLISASNKLSMPEQVGEPATSSAGSTVGSGQ